MKLTCYLKTTASLSSAFFLLLTPCVNASPLEDDAVPPPDHGRQSALIESADQLRERAVQSGRSGDYESAITILEQLLMRDADDNEAVTK